MTDREAVIIGLLIKQEAETQEWLRKLATKTRLEEFEENPPPGLTEDFLEAMKKEREERND